MKRMIIGLGVIILSIYPLRAYAGAPLETVQANVDRVLDVLRDPLLKEESATGAKKAKIESIAEDMFDFTYLSKRTLSKNWLRFNPEERKEFVKLYRTILENAYMGRILEYTDEKIVFEKEILTSEDKAEVQSRILTDATDIPIDYRMILQDETWKVYDVIIEGVSMIKNYRTQFKEILIKKTPEELLKILREKTEDDEKNKNDKIDHDTINVSGKRYK